MNLASKTASVPSTRPSRVAAIQGMAECLTRRWMSVTRRPVFRSYQVRLSSSVAVPSWSKLRQRAPYWAGPRKSWQRWQAFPCRPLSGWKRPMDYEAGKILEEGFVVRLSAPGSISQMAINRACVCARADASGNLKSRRKRNPKRRSGDCVNSRSRPGQLSGAGRMSA
jgi:hypothetical protein